MAERDYERGVQEGLDLRDALREENARLRWALNAACDRAWADGPGAAAAILRDAEKALAIPRKDPDEA